MKQTILLSITFLALNYSVSVGAVLADITEGIPTSFATQDTSVATNETVKPESAVDLTTLGNNSFDALNTDKPVTESTAEVANLAGSDGETTLVESPTPAQETEPTAETTVELSKRAEFVQLFIATVFAGKDAALETFTIENAKWVLAYVKVSALLMRNVTAEFIMWFVKMMNNLRASNTAPLA
jgi:hypothetical protein